MSVTKKHLTSLNIVDPNDGVYAQQVNYGQSSLRSISDVITRHFEDYNAKFVEDKIYSGFICSQSTGTDIQVSIGIATVKGIWVSSDSIITVTLPTTDGTYYIILQKGDDGGSEETRNPLNDTISLTYVLSSSYNSTTDFVLARVVISSSTISSFEDFGAYHTGRYDYIKPKNGSTVTIYTGSYPESLTKNAYFSGSNVYNLNDGSFYVFGVDEDFKIGHVSGIGNVIYNENGNDLLIYFSGVNKINLRESGIEIADGFTLGTLTQSDLITLNSGSMSISGTLNIGSNPLSGSSYVLSDTDMSFLDTLAQLSKTDGNFVVTNGTTFAVESGQTALTSLGFGTISNTPDIDQSLTTSSNVIFNSIGSGTLYSGAVIQDAFVANDITLDNITQITNRSHTNLSDIGIYTHSGIDAHIDTVSGNPHGVTKSDVGLGNVENTALSTWSGSSNITSLGTITTGVWNAIALTKDYVPSHNSLNGVSATEHIDWTTDVSATYTIHSNNFPSASTSSPGIVQLIDSVSSTSNSLAATANSVKTAYDTGNHAHSYKSYAHLALLSPSGNFGSGNSGTKTLTYVNVNDSYRTVGKTGTQSFVILNNDLGTFNFRLEYSLDGGSTYNVAQGDTPISSVSSGTLSHTSNINTNKGQSLIYKIVTTSTNWSQTGNTDATYTDDAELV